jgi:prepilin-type N-terminal cleavage/methylation domain-containing protein
MEKKYFSGFTLVELMIVIVIIAILATLAIMAFQSQILKGNDAKRKGDIDRIKIAVEEYEKDHNCYPLTVTCKPTGTGLQPYLDKIPCDPVTGASYVYENDGTSCPKWFRIYTTLQNTKDLSVIMGIGPGGAYNYYRGSDNAPVPIQSCAHDYWGCKGGSCVPIGSKPGCSGPICHPGFDNADCNSSGNCGSYAHPQNECTP